ncbi:hypothetical protein MCHI_002908 [Candidatus Magnetoovum chiemensis]|nr:hypothetical protein MCHI_002908 [Candidatus Magnetoovum chiemensis]
MHLFYKERHSFLNGELTPYYVFYNIKDRYPLLGRTAIMDIHEYMLANDKYELIYNENGCFLYKRYCTHGLDRARCTISAD